METKAGRLRINTYTGPYCELEKYGSRRCVQITDPVNASFVCFNLTELGELIRALERIREGQ